MYCSKKKSSNLVAYVTIYKKEILSIVTFYLISTLHGRIALATKIHISF